VARIVYLTELIPKDDLLFWHSLDEPNAQDGEDVEAVRDDWGAFTLSVAANFPEWKNLRTGEQYINFDGSNDPLSAEASGTLRHLFVIAGYSAAAFPAGGDGYKGLISPMAADLGILAGDPGTTRFFDFGYSDAEYRKSGVLYAANNMQAPMSNVPELVELIIPGGIAIDSLQIGQDRDFSARKWSGKVFAVIGYSQIKTGLELEKIRLYADLRARLWEALNKTLLFPRNLLIKGFPTYSRFYAPPLDFKAVTHSHTYADESKTFNQTNDLPPRKFEIGLNNLTAEQVQIWDAFAENVRLVQTFNFFDYRSGKTWTNMRVEDYNRTHEGHLSRTKNNAVFTISQFKFGYANPIDDESPEINLISATLGVGVVNVAGTLSDVSEFVSLQLYVNGVAYGSPVSTATGFFTLPVDVAEIVEGVNSFYVTGEDESGNEAVSNTISAYFTPDPYVPDVPGGLDVSGTSISEMLITWYPAADEEAYGSETGDDYLGV